MSNKTVLVTDDDAAIRRLLRTILEELGWAVTEANDGEAAVALMAENDYQLLMLDFQMPRLDGLGVLERARAMGYHRSVIFLSANAELVDRDRIALGDCCASLLPKPISLERLQAAIGAAEARVHHRDCVHWPEAGSY